MNKKRVFAVGALAGGAAVGEGTPGRGGGEGGAEGAGERGGVYFFAKKRSTRSGESICHSEATVQPGAKMSL